MVRFAVLLAALTVLSTPTPSRAQQASGDQGRAWVSVGLGGGSFSGAEDPGIALLASLVLRESRHRIAVRGSIVAEVLGDGVLDLGVLYGRAWTGARSERSLSAGIAIVRGEDCHGLFGGPCDPSNAVGLPLSATMSFRPSRLLGLGLEAFANLNTLASFVGLGGMIELGMLR